MCVAGTSRKKDDIHITSREYLTTTLTNLQLLESIMVLSIAILILELWSITSESERGEAFFEHGLYFEAILFIEL